MEATCAVSLSPPSPSFTRSQEQIRSTTKVREDLGDGLEAAIEDIGKRGGRATMLTVDSMIRRLPSCLNS